jgi:hypothetical protein
MTVTIPSHHNPGDTGHAADHNAIVDALTSHDQSIATLQGATTGLFYISGNNTSNIAGTTTPWATVNLPTGSRDAAVDTYAVFHGSNKIFWLDGYGHPRTKNDDPTHTPDIIDSVVGQTANLAEWRVNGVTKVAIAADGTVVAPNITPGTWTDITLASGLVRNSSLGHKPQYRVVGGCAELRGNIAKSNGTDFTVTPTQLGTLPSAASPGAYCYGVGASQFNGDFGWSRLEVRPDGTLWMYFSHAASPAYSPGWVAIDNFRYALGPAT